MPITKDGDGKIIYTQPSAERLAEDTGVVADVDFAIADTVNVLKQVKFDIVPQDNNPGTLTLQANIGADVTLDLTAVAAAVPQSRTISTAAPLTGGGDLSSNRTITINQSNTTTDGYLSSTDWNTFNNKQAALGYTPENSANKGVSNGYASLNSSGKVPVSQLPSSVMEYQGAWDASTNSPTLADGVGDNGDIYRTSVAGTQNLGSGNQTFFVGDFIVYNGFIWERSPAADGVTSVNGATGDVTLTRGNLTESTSSVLTITGGTNSVWGSGTSVQVSQASGSTSGYLSSTDWNTFNNKQASGNYVTALTGDVSATGPGSVSATVNTVGGSSASAVNSATVLANAATDANTVSTIVKRDASGNFSAGTITASLSGNVTGNVTGNVSGTSANVTGTVAIANGGTGQTTATNAFSALAPTTTLGDIVYRGALANDRLAGNTTTTKQFLTQTGNGTISAAPSWGTVASADLPTITLTSDVTGAASGGSITTTVASVGGSTAAQVHQAELAANAATHLNTLSTIVKRDASGDFSAGTITASLSGNATNVTGTVAVANGGTGANSLTANNVLLGNGTSAIQVVAPGTSGNVLTSNGTTWTSAAPSGGGTITAWAVDSGAAITGGGTTSSASIWRRRVGDSYEYRGHITLGTVAASTAALTFSGWTIDTAKMTSSTNAQCVGYWNFIGSFANNLNTSTASGQVPLFYDGSTNDRLFFTREGGATSNQFSKQNGNTIWNNDGLIAFFITGIPVSGFST